MALWIACVLVVFASSTVANPAAAIVESRGDEILLKSRVFVPEAGAPAAIEVERTARHLLIQLEQGRTTEALDA